MAKIIKMKIEIIYYVNNQILFKLSLKLLLCYVNDEISLGHFSMCTFKSWEHSRKRQILMWSLLAVLVSEFR